MINEKRWIIMTKDKKNVIRGRNNRKFLYKANSKEKNLPQICLYTSKGRTEGTIKTLGISARRPEEFIAIPVSVKINEIFPGAAF